MSNYIPRGAVVASALLLIYSVICLAASMLLFCMLHFHGERWNCEADLLSTKADADTGPDVSLLALTVCLSTTPSIVQQVYFALEWRQIKIVEYEQTRASLETPSIGSGPHSRG